MAPEATGYNDYNSVGVIVDFVAGTADEAKDAIIDDTFTSIENVKGSNFDDVIIANSLVNSIQATDGNDVIYGGSGNDYILYGQNGNDVIYGEAGSDTLSGGTNNDVIHGGDDSDTLWGDDGNYHLYGGAGVDTLRGDTGADTFFFESGTAFRGNDIITDFSAAQGDAIDIADLLTGYDPMTDLISDFVMVGQDSSNTYLHVDTDGTGSAEVFRQILTVQNVINLGSVQDMIDNGRLVIA